MEMRLNSDVTIKSESGGAAFTGRGGPTRALIDLVLDEMFGEPGKVGALNKACFHDDGAKDCVALTKDNFEYDITLGLLIARFGVTTSGSYTLRRLVLSSGNVEYFNVLVEPRQVNPNERYSVEWKLSCNCENNVADGIWSGQGIYVGRLIRGSLFGRLGGGVGFPSMLTLDRVIYHDDRIVYAEATLTRDTGGRRAYHGPTKITQSGKITKAVIYTTDGVNVILFEHKTGIDVTPDKTIELEYRASIIS
ncbi:MAG: hypothetical protein C4294_18110 [Nitrospiraceae bacterium]